jgi:hypothetical protein
VVARGGGVGEPIVGVASTGFEFLAVSSMAPAQFRCQLNRQCQSRHLRGPGRTLVCIQRTPT